MEALKRNILYMLSSFFCAFIFFFFLFFSAKAFLNVPIDSDYANLVLEANDILSGNIFLKGWNLTGITFFTTDLPYFIFGALLFGVSESAYFAAIILMYFVLSISCVLLILPKDKEKFPLSLFILLCTGGFPCYYSCEVLRAHTPVFSYVFFALFFMQKILSSQKAKQIHHVLFVIFLAIAFAGDPITLVFGILPILIFSICGMFFYPSQRKIYLKILILDIIAAILGKLAEFAFLMGGTNKNSFISTRGFISEESIISKTLLYLKCLLKMQNAYFFNGRISEISTLISAFRAILVLFSLYIIIKNLISFANRLEFDSISLILSLGFLFLSLVFIFTDISVDIYSARYMGAFPMLCGILIARFFSTKRTFFNKILIFFMSTLFLIAAIFPWNSFNKKSTPQERLADFLLQNGLESGCSAFWDASHTTVSSLGKVKVRAVTFQNGNLSKFSWFCKDEWYSEPFRFVVINPSNKNADFGITEENMRKSLGIPRKILVFEDYIIYVYGKNISENIRK
ncbi:MAG: hypothetical protein PWQ76_7 [Clostridiales bacterium]|nr:hypothetical protein [Clostridiales bacterium]